MKSRRGEKIKKKRSISGHELQQHLAGCLKKQGRNAGGDVDTRSWGDTSQTSTRRSHPSPRQGSPTSPAARVPPPGASKYSSDGGPGTFFFTENTSKLGTAGSGGGKNARFGYQRGGSLQLFASAAQRRHRCRLAIAAGNCVSQARSGGLDKLCMSLVCWC